MTILNSDPKDENANTWQLYLIVKQDLMIHQGAGEGDNEAYKDK